MLCMSSGRVCDCVRACVVGSLLCRNEFRINLLLRSIFFSVFFHYYLLSAAPKVPPASQCCHQSLNFCLFVFGIGHKRGRGGVWTKIL